MTPREELIEVIASELKRSAIIDSTISDTKGGYYVIDGEFNLGAVSDAIIEWALKK